MHRIRPIHRWLPIAGSVVFFAVVSLAASPTVPVSSILSNPEQFDGKDVTIRGTAAAVKQTISRRGNPYTTFQVQDNGAEITIFTFGHPDTKNGNRVEVTGIFTRAKHVGANTFYNEIEARKVGPAQ
jgi:hypothetical protein